MKIQLSHTYNDIIKLENLLLAWEDFVADKKEKVDVELFSRYLMDNIVSLHHDLASKTYKHGGYTSNGNNPSLRGGARATTRQSKSLDNEIASSAMPPPRNDGEGLKI